MLGVLAKYIQDVSVVRRLLFAVVFLSPDLPMYWQVASTRVCNIWKSV